MQSPEQTFSIDIALSDTLQKLKTRIEKHHGYPADIQVLSRHGQELWAYSTMMELNIKHGDTLMLYVRNL